MRHVRAVVMLAIVAMLGGCASAGMPGDNGDDDAIDAAATPHPDARVNPPGTPDARVTSMIDAAVPKPDAWMPQPIDAAVPPGTIDAGGIPGFCTSDGMCGPGMCCLTLGMPSGICTAGMTIPGIGCVPM